MAKPKLTYFDFHGGRGEVARLAFYIGGVPFEDNRVPGSEWSKLKPNTPFGGLPLLEVDGQVVSQSNGINRYVGKLAGLYPTDAWQAALCDEVMDAVEDAYYELGTTFAIKDEAQKKAARLAVANGPLSLYLTRTNALLERRGGEYFADNRLTVADLKVFRWIRHLKSGKLDYIATDLADRLAPLLVKHHDKLLSLPKVAEYYANKSGY